jgi:hypothetical protein
MRADGGSAFPSWRLAKERNRIVHATYVEIKVGGDVAAILLSDMKRSRETQQITLDQESLSENSFANLMREIGEIGIQLGFTHKQLIHWNV